MVVLPQSFKMNVNYDEEEYKGKNEQQQKDKPIFTSQWLK